MKLISSLLLAGSSLATFLQKPFLPSNNVVQDWINWKHAHPEIQISFEEESNRFQNFKNAAQFVKDHNLRYEQGLETFHVSLNKFAHMDNVEFAQSYLGTPYTLTTEYQCPTTYNSRTAGSTIGSVSYKNTYATSVKDQGSCGSCWTFGAAMAIEAAICKTGKQNCRTWSGVSAQQILDCASSNSNLNPYNNNGCNGGFQQNAMRWVWYENGGIANEKSYSSYAGRQSTCKSGTDAGTISSCASMSGTDENGMSALIKNHGPATIAIDASGVAFQLYSGGTYSSSSCSSSRLNHAVGVTGFTSSTWEVKNSWGTGWGDAGYAHFARGSNMCGVASDVAWALT